ncbi:hypothetical protein [Nostoc sp. FACHB-892]
MYTLQASLRGVNVMTVASAIIAVKVLFPNSLQKRRSLIPIN